MTRLNLEPEDYASTRGDFRAIAARLAIFREVLLEYGFSEDEAGRICCIWLGSVRYVDADDDEEEG